MTRSNAAHPPASPHSNALPRAKRPGVRWPSTARLARTAIIVNSKLTHPPGSRRLGPRWHVPRRSEAKAGAQRRHRFRSHRSFPNHPEPLARTIRHSSFCPPCPLRLCGKTAQSNQVKPCEADVRLTLDLNRNDRNNTFNMQFLNNKRQPAAKSERRLAAGFRPFNSQRRPCPQTPPKRLCKSLSINSVKPSQTQSNHAYWGGDSLSPELFPLPCAPTSTKNAAIPLVIRRVPDSQP